MLFSEIVELRALQIQNADHFALVNHGNGKLGASFRVHHQVAWVGGHILNKDRLAKRGYDLILVARRADRLDAVAKELKGRYGVSVQTLVADLGAETDLDRVVNTISRDESITLLLNNAGTSTLGSVGEIKEPDLQAMIGVNITALTRLTVAVLPGFKKRNAGTIINMGSVLGFQSLPISSIYSGTKGFVLNFTRGLQDETTKIPVLREQRQNGKRERRCLASAGLGRADQVLARENNWESAELDRRGFREAHRLGAPDDFRRQAKIFE